MKYPPFHTLWSSGQTSAVSSAVREFCKALCSDPMHPPAGSMKVTCHRSGRYLLGSSGISLYHSNPYALWYSAISPLHRWHASHVAGPPPEKKGTASCSRNTPVILSVTLIGSAWTAIPPSCLVHCTKAMAWLRGQIIGFSKFCHSQSPIKVTAIVGMNTIPVDLLHTHILWCPYLTQDTPLFWFMVPVGLNVDSSNPPWKVFIFAISINFVLLWSAGADGLSLLPM